MAKRKEKVHPQMSAGVVGMPPDVAAGFDESGGLTGRYIVTFKPGAEKAAGTLMKDKAGMAEMASSADFVDENFDVAGTLDESGGIRFERLGVAVVDMEPSSLMGLSAAEPDSPILSVEPERIMYAINEYGNSSGVGGGGYDAAGIDGGTVLEYLRGYRDAIDALYSQLATAGADYSGEYAEEQAAPMSGPTPQFAPFPPFPRPPFPFPRPPFPRFPIPWPRFPRIPVPQPLPIFNDTAAATWGLQATRAINSQATGAGIRVAVLDTGFDLGHPDFAGRTVVSRSFIAGEPVQDGNGHGTHCIGTSCGPRQPTQGPSYGVAYQAQIYAGKVLSNAGSGADSGILAGIDWALGNQCQVISMSLGAVAGPSPAYETIGARCLDAGTLIVAAAGNHRQSHPGQTVARPANSDSIMAVAAIDNKYAVASFSAPGNSSGGGQIDIAGPGVAIYSSWPRPTTYRTISGTSMATPHVAGIAALFAQVRGLRGRALWQALTAAARRLPAPSTDVGAGIAQAP